jgi:hypothetical protein
MMTPPLRWTVQMPETEEIAGHQPQQDVWMRRRQAVPEKLPLVPPQLDRHNSSNIISSS